ncbi:MAG: hypothetical protein ABSG85_15965 [Spirochaetia bacterium]|jgi:hypothetical protein
MNRFFTYSGAAPGFSATDFDYDALCAGLRRPLDRQKVFEALRIFIFENWGRTPTSNSVVKSLLRIEKASKNAVPPLERLFLAFSVANSEAHVELRAAIPLRMEDFPDYHDFRKLANRLPLIARAAGTAAHKVPKLQRGRPGKGEFSGLVLRLHKAFEAAGGKGWITFKSDYDVQSDSDTYTVGGAFLPFLCDAIRQIKPFLRGAPVQRLLPEGVDVNTDGITERERNAVAQAISALRSIKAVRQGRKRHAMQLPENGRPREKGKYKRTASRVSGDKNRK